MGRKFEFGPPHFSFPPSHLLNLLALPLPSSPGQSLTARLVESQYSFRVCVCVRLHVCVCGRERGGEREGLCACVQATGRAREAPGSCAPLLSHRIVLQSCPATAPAQTRALRHDWLDFTSIHDEQPRTRLLYISRPLSLSSLPLLVYLSPYYPSRSLLTRDYIR